METLGKLFGSEVRVRLLRLFFLNPDDCFEARDAAKRTKTSQAKTRKELSVLSGAGIIKRVSFFKEVKGKSKHRPLVKKKASGWCLDKSLHCGEQMKNLLISADLVRKNYIINRFQRAGRIKLIIIAGIFIRADDSRVDILVVGDKLKRGTIENILKSIEAEAGKELRYAVLDTQEFRYRLGIYDKFVRDVLDFPHAIVIDRLGVSKTSE